MRHRSANQYLPHFGQARCETLRRRGLCTGGGAACAHRGPLPDDCVPSAQCIIIIDVFVLVRDPTILPASKAMIDLVKTTPHGVVLIRGPALFVEVGASSWASNGSQRGCCIFHQGHGPAEFLPAVLSFGEAAPGL